MTLNRTDNPARGIALTVLGTGLITVNDAAMKWVVADHPIGEAIFVRGLFALIPIAFLVRRAGGLAALRCHSAPAQLLCALLLVVPLFIYVFSLSRLPLSIATLILFTNPLFVTALAHWVLGERVGWRRRSAVLAGFVGAAIVIQPTGASFSWIMLGPVLVAFFVSVRDLLIRRLVTTETSVSLLAYSAIAVTLTAACTFPLGWTPLSVLDLVLLAGAGVGFGFGIYCLTDALRYADASLTSLYKYSAVVWALLLGFFVWGDLPPATVWPGAALIVASGLYILYRERQQTGT